MGGVHRGPDQVAERYYVELAAAYVRGRLGGAPDEPSERVFAAGMDAGLRLHAFKRSATLPRVRRALGMLQGLAPRSLVDVGSGRGVFLWPLLDTLPELRVLAIDRDARRVAAIQTVHAGGVARLTTACMDAEQLALGNHAVDGVTLLEVLEHVRHPERAAAEALRVAGRFVVVSVPSKADDNPEHIHRFDSQSLAALLRGARARRVTVEYVLNHMIALARV